MNEFIEKLIGRLEEEHEKCINRYGIVGGNLPAVEVKRCMEIVDQLAEEHKEQHSDQDLMIVASLPSLYPLQAFEEEAIHRVVERAKSSNIQTIDVSELLGESEQVNDGWIPCSDAVPQDGDWVLCYGTNREGRIKYEVSTYAHEIQCWMCSRIAEVIAWQPLPAPYQPKGE